MPEGLLFLCVFQGICQKHLSHFRKISIHTEETMKIWQNETELTLKHPVAIETFKESILFFDIETTGFSPYTRTSI